MLLSLQITSILVAVFLVAESKAPPGYIKPPESPDKNPPKYEYGYNIEDAKGQGQGKAETRDGIYALGRYYVQGTESAQSVQYYADDWGYHPYVEYSNVGPHSKTRTQLLLGVEAVKALATNKFTQNNVEPKQHVAQTIQKINENRPQAQALQSQQIVQQVQLQPQPQPVQVVQHQAPPQIQVQQPQQIVQQVAQQQQIVQQEAQQQQIVQQEAQQQQIVQQEAQPQQILQQVSQPQQILQHVQQPQQILQQVAQPQQTVQHQVTQPQIVEQPQHIFFQQPPQENLVYFQQEAQPQQLVFYQQQQQQQQQQQSQIQENLVEVEKQAQQLETAALFENSNNRVTAQQASTTNDIDESSLENLGGYGNKIGVEQSRPTHYLRQQDHPLIQTTRNLVSGEDVLNINGAFVKEAYETETSTAKSIVTEYASSSTVSDVQINTKGYSGAISSTTVAPVISTEASLNKEPIIVADFEEKSEIESSTAHAIVSSTVPSTVLVTPRPVSTNFLAPITAGVQLQSVENVEQQIEQKQNYLVEIQKSLPYYLGKFEYTGVVPLVRGTAEEKAVENIELGKTLISFPEPQIYEGGNKLLLQQPPEKLVKENFVEADQQQAQAVVQQVPVVVEKQVAVPVPVVETKIVEKPVEVTKLLEVPVPVPVDRHIPYPVEKIVEKPITQIVEKLVPTPYPVDRIVEKAVHVPVEVTRYIDRPYAVPVAHPVPYPVDRIVEKIVNQPYPVEVRVPVEVKVPVTVEKIVEKKVHVPHYIEKQVPVEKHVPHYIDRPYPVEVQVAPQAYVLPLDVSKPYPVTYSTLPQQYTFKLPILQQHIQKYTHSKKQHVKQQQVQEQQLNYFYTNPSYAPSHGYVPAKLNNEYVPSKPNNNAYLPPHDCVEQHKSGSIKNYYYTIKPDDYIGLLPPKFQQQQQQQNALKSFPRKFRNARSNFNSNNLRLEYGFMPPLIPSQEVDEHGNPIEKGDN